MTNKKALLVLVVLFGCTNKFFEPNDPVDLRSCTVSTDCISVTTKNCCDCYETINKNYSDYWQKRSHASCDNIQCSICQKFINPVVDCIANSCHIIEDTNLS